METINFFCSHHFETNALCIMHDKLKYELFLVQDRETVHLIAEMVTNRDNANEL